MRDDAAHVADVAGAHTQIIHREGHTVVLINHDNSSAVQAERIIRLEDGQVVYDGDAHAPEAIVQPTLSGEAAQEEAK